MTNRTRSRAVLVTLAAAISLAATAASIGGSPAGADRDAARTEPSDVPIPDGYRHVVDDSGTISVAIPASWTHVSTGLPQDRTGITAARAWDDQNPHLWIEVLPHHRTVPRPEPQCPDGSDEVVPWQNQRLAGDQTVRPVHREHRALPGPALPEGT